MKNNTTLSDLIFILEQSDNTFVVERLKELRDMSKEFPNSYDLGEEFRKICF